MFRAVLVLLSSLLFLAACQKEEGKRPALRRSLGQTKSNTDAKTGTQTPIGPQQKLEPTRAGETSRSPLGNKSIDGTGMVCGLENLSDICDAVLVVTSDDTVKPIGSEIYNQNEGRPVHKEEVKESETGATAEVTVDSSSIVFGNPVVAFIQSKTEPLSVQDLNGAIHVVSADAQLSGVREALANLPVTRGEHVLFLSQLADIPATDATEFESVLEQKTSQGKVALQVVSSREQLDEKIAAEAQFLQSHLAQLTYRWTLPSFRNAEELKVEVLFDDTALSEEQFSYEIPESSPRQMKVTIKDLQLFKKPQYKITIKLLLAE